MVATTKELIKDTMTSIVCDFLYEDRADDDDLPEGSIQRAVADGVIDPRWIAEEFEKALKQELGESE